MGLLLGLSVCLVLGVGYWRMFSHFPGYDDEGYIMLTVRDYLAGGGLYGTVYTQYGPGFYVLMDVVFGLPGWAITHALVRWFTLGWWLAAAVGGAELVRHQTRKDGVAIAVGVVVFLYLCQFSEEAFHPGAVVVGLIPWMLRFMGSRSASETGRSLAIWAGAGTAFLGLLKINVGGLFGVGFVVWYLLLGRSSLPSWGRRLSALGVGGIAITVLFMGSMQEPWVMLFWLLCVIGLIGIAAVVDAEREMAWSEVGVGVLAGVVTVALVGGVVMLRGTSTVELLQGVLLGPLQHADDYSFAIDWRPGTLVNAILALGVLVGYVKLSRSEKNVPAKLGLVGLRPSS